MGRGSVHNNIDKVDTNAIVVQARNVTDGIHTTTYPAPAPKPAGRPDGAENDD